MYDLSRPCVPITVRLMHGPRLDGSPRVFYDEQVKITRVIRTGGRILQLMGASAEGLLVASPDWSPAHTYSEQIEHVLNLDRPYTARCGRPGAPWPLFYVLLTAAYAASG